MRKHLIDITVSSDIDLTKLGSKRLCITKTEEGNFKIVSAFRVFACERHAVVYKYLSRRKHGLVAISGQCSAPSGYYWSRPTTWANVAPIMA